MLLDKKVDAPSFAYAKELAAKHFQKPDIIFGSGNLSVAQQEVCRNLERDMGGEFIQVTGDAGERFRAFKSLPRSGSGPEIFGINPHIRDVADFYAEEGYVALGLMARLSTISRR